MKYEKKRSKNDSRRLAPSNDLHRYDLKMRFEFLIINSINHIVAM